MAGFDSLVGPLACTAALSTGTELAPAFALPELAFSGLIEEPGIALPIVLLN